MVIEVIRLRDVVAVIVLALMRLDLERLVRFSSVLRKVSCDVS